MRYLLVRSLVCAAIGCGLGLVVGVYDVSESRSRVVPVKVYQLPDHLTEEEKVRVREMYRVESEGYGADECYLSPMPWLFGGWCRVSRYTNLVVAVFVGGLVGLVVYPVGLFGWQRWFGR